MNWLEFISSLVSSLAWPAVILFGVFLFKKPLSALIGRIRSIERGEDGNVKLSFEEVLSEIPAPKKEVVLDENSNIKQLAKVSPKSAVLEAWIEIERAAREKLASLPIEVGDKQWLKRDPISFFSYKSIFPPSVESDLQRLRFLRNQIVHATDQAIPEEDALRYVEIAQGIRQEIEGLVRVPKFSLTPLTFLVLVLNAAIDTGKYQGITVKEIYDAIKAKNVLPFVKEKVGDDIDLSMYLKTGSYSDFVKFYNEELLAYYEAYGGDHRRKWGVENSGLCLLLAWTNEIIQNGSGWNPPDNTAR